MREIIYRGKAINKIEGEAYRSKYKNGDWVYGLITQIPGFTTRDDLCAEMKDYIGIDSIEVGIKTLCQYTSLTDKNGTKIFEHDIISAHLDDLFPENETRLVVVWHDYGFFGINPRYIDYTQYQIDLITMITSKQSEMKDVLFDSLENEFVKKFEVIGNIYDNPELLK